MYANKLTDIENSAIKLASSENTKLKKSIESKLKAVKNNKIVVK